MALKEHTVPSLTALIAHMLDHSTGQSSWFRGQGCDRRTLSTSLNRRMTSADPNHVLQVERRLITRFRQRSLPLWPEGYAQRDWEQLFAMQHVGVPTRLLDWTESLMVAVYFAADHDTGRCECGTGACTPTVWVLNPVSLNELNPRLEGMRTGILTTTDPASGAWAPNVSETAFGPTPISIYGTHNSARIVAQQGTFTVGGKDPNPLDASTTVAKHDRVLEKILIEAGHEALMQQLRVLGVRRSTVYPDLPGLAQDIATEEVF